jgi:hypothetical protein
MRIDFVPIGRPKMWLGRFPESIVSIVLQSLRLIFYLVAGPKGDLGGIEKVTFQVFEWPSELIFCLFEVPKCDLVEVEKASRLAFSEPCELVFCVPTPKMRLWRCRESYDWKGQQALWTNFLLSGTRKMRFRRFREFIFCLMICLNATYV